MEPHGPNLAEYIATAHGATIPEDVRARALLHILDTIAAILTGSEMPAGVAAKRWLDMYEPELGGGGCTVIGHGRRAKLLSAGLVNGMAAHGDETDDSHADTLSHPGCGIVPAALAVGEQLGATGEDLVSAVVIGYDAGCRVGRAIGGKSRRALARGQASSHAIVSTFGAASAAARLMRLQTRQVADVLSYTAQLASGVTTWMRDAAHIEKAFVFAGMPVQHGILAATLVAAGWPGVQNALEVSPSWLEAVCETPAPEWLDRELGLQFEVMSGTIKKYCVGSPGQAAVEGVIQLIEADGLTADDVQSIEIHLPAEQVPIVNDSKMSNVNTKYLIAATLLDEAFSFTMAHDHERMHDEPRTRALMERISIIPDEARQFTRSAELVIVTDGNGGPRELRRVIDNVRGTAGNPMTRTEVVAKARDVLGYHHQCDEARADAIIATTLDLDRPGASVHDLLKHLS